MEWPRIPLPGWPAPGAAADSPASASVHSALPSTSAGETPALPRTAAYGSDGPTEECPRPRNVGVPPADKSNANAKESGAKPSGQAGGKGAAEALAQSAAQGRKLAALLDPDMPVPGVTQAPLRPELAAIAVPATANGRNMTGDDFALSAGWGHFGTAGPSCPAKAGLRNAHTPTKSAPPCITLSLPLRQPPRRTGPFRPAGTPRRKGRPHFPRRDHFRHLPERPRPLAQRPRRRLALQAGRLPSPQEVALLPRAQHPGPSPAARRSPALHRHRPPNRRHAAPLRQRPLLTQRCRHQCHQALQTPLQNGPDMPSTPNHA